MQKPLRISTAEWAVMEAFWQRAPLSAQGAIDILGKRYTWKPKTIETMVRRLFRKGVLTYTPGGKARLYSPKLGRNECVRREIGSLLQRAIYGVIDGLEDHRRIRQRRMSLEESRELADYLGEINAWAEEMLKRHKSRNKPLR